MERILVGIDGSEPGRRALSKAVSLAKQSGARLCLVYVGGLVAYPSELHGMLETHAKELEDQAKAIVAGAAKQCGEVPTETLIRFGSVPETLAELGEEQKVDLLVVGKRGRSRLARLLLGSVADKLAHIASVPLLIVP